MSNEMADAAGGVPQDDQKILYPGGYVVIRAVRGQDFRISKGAGPKTTVVFPRGTGVRVVVTVPPITGVSSLSFAVKTYRTWVELDGMQLKLGRDTAPVDESYFEDEDEDVPNEDLFQGVETIPMDTDDDTEILFKHTNTAPLGQYTMFGRATSGMTTYGFVFVYELTA